MADLARTKQKQLAECEAIIKQSLQTFIAVGNAIARIHDGKLYEMAGYETFADYMEQRWGWTASQGYKQIRAAKVATLLSDGNVSYRTRPTTETQLRPLTLNELTDEQVVEAWNDALYLANEERGLEDPKHWQPPFERHVRYVVNELLSERRRSRPQKLTELGKFNILYCDPPWQYDYSFSNSRAIERFYGTMTMSELFAMAGDIRSISAENALIFLWCPPAFTRKAIILMRVWGFDYRTNLVWVKPSIGAGQWVRQQHEMLMLGRRGDFPTPEGTLRPASVIQDRRHEHSEKPAVVYEIIERMYPDNPKVELFARSERPGWISWGDEVQQKSNGR